jgi:hypothetical protein
MMLGGVNPAAVRCSNDDRATQAATGAVTHARHMVHDLIERRIQKSHELDFCDGLQSLRRHPHRHAGDGRLRERRILHPVLAEAFLQPRGGAEHTTVDPHVLTDHDHVGVMLHFPAMRHRDGFNHGYFRQFNDRWIWSRICGR